MSAAKHTPGPWFVDGVRFVRQEPAPRHVICRLPTTRNEGDARLIAAAPDLLEALQDLTLNVNEAMSTGGWVPTPLQSSFWAAMSDSLAAIAKATGVEA